MPDFSPPEVKPGFINIADLLKWVKEGKLRVARFQRPFRWDRGRVVDLFDSIRKQFPIGTLLLWVPGPGMPSEEKLGPLRLPSSGGGDLILIDGQQRAASIAGVLLLGSMERVKDVEDPGMWDLWFDASDERFRHLSGEPPPAACIRVRDLMEIRAIMNAAAKLPAALAREEGEQEAQLGLFQGDRRAVRSLQERASEIVDRWQSAATALSSYRLPVVEFHTMDLNIAVESFTRLNRRGLPLSPDEMWSALADPKGERARLSDTIDGVLRAVVEAGFGRLDRLTALRLILLELEFDPFRTDWNRLSERDKDTTRATLSETGERCRDALMGALRWLREEMDLVSLRLLPYSGMLVGLATYFGASPRSLPTSERDRLKRWCWGAAFAGFAEGNPSRATALWRAMREAGKTPFSLAPLPQISPHARATPFPSRYDQRAARLQASLWANMSTWGLTPDEREGVSKFVNNHGADAWRRVIDPRTTKLGGEQRHMLSSPANWVFDLWGSGSPERSPRRGPAGSDLVATVDDSPTHQRLQVSADALSALRDGRWMDFLQSRLARMIADEREFMVNVGVEPPADSTPQPPAIDREE